MIKAIIFDMDGVILDSNQAIYDNWNSIFSKRSGMKLPKDEFSSHMGRNGKDFAQFFLKKYGAGLTMEELWKELHETHAKMLSSLRLKPGVKDVLPILKKHFKIALATGASRKIANNVLDHFSIKEHFNFVTGGDDVNEGKPNPETFLKAANNLNQEPFSCVVIEDAILGLKAAKAAGMYCITIDDPFTRGFDYSIADYRIKSMAELNYELIKTIGDK